MAAAIQKNISQKNNPKKRSPLPAEKAGTVNGILNPGYALAAILVFTALVFSNSITKNFLAFDDSDYVINNPYIKSLSWESLKKIFTVFHYANYHPLTTLIYAIEYSLFKLNAAPYHALNLLIHLVNVCLVFVLLKKLATGSWQLPIALFGALFFGIHPMHVESVSWISELKDVLYSLFYISGLIAYLNYLRDMSASGQSDKTINRRWLIYSFILFFLSLLSKPAANTFPLLLFLFDYFFRRKWSLNLLLEKIPFLIFALAFGVITVMAQRAGGALTDVTRPPYSIIERFFVICYALVFYPVRFFLPVDLIALHYAPKELTFYYYLSPLLLAGIIILIMKAKRIKREIIFGLLFYLSTIILVVQIIPVGYVNVSERYSYVPYIGLWFSIGSFLFEKFKLQAATLRNVLITVSIVFGFLSFQRNKTWHDTLSLFTDNSEKNPASAQAQFVLGEKQYETGDFNGALISYNRSIELDSTPVPVYFWRGNTYMHMERYPEALADLKKAAAMKPGYIEAYNNIGSIFMKMNDYENAILYFSKCITIKPTEYLYLNRGLCYYNLKKYKEAAEDYSKSIQLNSSIAETYFNRGVCFFNLQQQDKACDDWTKATSLGYEKAPSLKAKYCK